MNKRLIMTGFFAGLVMGMLVMLYEVFWGQGFWSPLVYISAVVFRDLQNVSSPVSFNMVPVITGLMVHMINSWVLTLVFVSFLKPRLKTKNSLVIGALIYALLIFGVMWYIVIQIIDPVMLNLNAYVFALSHIMWGFVLAIGLSRTIKVKS